MRIPISQPNLSDLERQYVQEAVQSGWVSSLGPFTPRFEDLLAAKVHRQHAQACTNGTVALELALRASDIGSGDEVLLPALTFVAPAAVVRQVGAVPVLVDVTADSWTIDPECLLAAITPRTTAVIAVDLLGHPYDWWHIKDSLAARNILLIEDAAQAHGAQHQYGYACGQLGDVSTFSFYGNKSITTGEGGAVLTDDPRLAAKLRLIANHGMTPQRLYWHEVVGMNGRMTNVTAALGVAQMERWDDLTAARKRVADQYDARLQPLFEAGVLQRRPVAHWARESCWLYTVASPNRALFLDALRKAGIDARAIWTALPDNPAYVAYDSGNYPVARQVAAEAFQLPTWAGMPEEMIDEISEVIESCLVKR